MKPPTEVADVGQSRGLPPLKLRLRLRVLLGLAQEQEIKMGRFGSVYADESIIAHSNEGDFKEFSANPKTEALLDRIITIKIPYNLRVSEEQLIYDRMLHESGFHQGDAHISPLALPVMATFAVLSRLGDHGFFQAAGG